MEVWRVNRRPIRTFFGPGPMGPALWPNCLRCVDPDPQTLGKRRPLRPDARTDVQEVPDSDRTARGNPSARSSIGWRPHPETKKKKQPPQSGLQTTRRPLHRRSAPRPGKGIARVQIETETFFRGARNRLPRTAQYCGVSCRAPPSWIATARKAVDVPRAPQRLEPLTQRSSSSPRTGHLSTSSYRQGRREHAAERKSGTPPTLPPLVPQIPDSSCPSRPLRPPRLAGPRQRTSFSFRRAASPRGGDSPELSRAVEARKEFIIAPLHGVGHPSSIARGDAFSCRHQSMMAGLPQ